MAYIPEDATWYLAELVEEITVGGEANNAVHVNVILLRADSPEKAFEKAMKHGKSDETTYLNPEDKLVTIHFCGLRDLLVIYEDLEDGAEILWEEYVGLSAEEMRNYIKPKERLSVFRPWDPPAVDRPNYASKEIVQEVEKFARHLRDAPEQSDAPSDS